MGLLTVRLPCFLLLPIVILCTDLNQRSCLLRVREGRQENATVAGRGGAATRRGCSQWR